MKGAVVYIHGKGGSAAESGHYRPLFPDCDVIGLDYRASVPWEAGKEIHHKYLCYVREHPAEWNTPTAILYGRNDALTSYEAVAAFAEKHRASLTVMENGEHWFHTEEQLIFLDKWIREISK